MRVDDRSCRATLQRVDAGEVPPPGGVVYRSHGVVVVIGDDAVAALDAAVALAARRDVIAVAPGLRQRPGMPERLEVRDGVATRVDGWLGAFRVGIDGHGGALDADVVVDLHRTPRIDRSVRPFGYLPTCGDEAARGAAVAAALEYAGVFHKPKYFTYTPSICAHESYGLTGCTRCLDVCDAHAIQSKGALVEVEPHLCQGCAACALACPTGALSVSQPSRSMLLDGALAAIDSARASGAVPTLHVVEAGRARPQGEVVIETPAIAAFGDELWLAAIARGATRVVLHARPDTPARTRALLETRVAECNALAQALGRALPAVVLVDGDACDVQSRAAVDTVGAPAPQQLGDERKRDHLNRALAGLEPPGGLEPRPLPAGSPLGTIVVDAGACVMCGVCASACPTASIRTGQSGGEARLEFAEANCVQCGLCERLCPEHAIALQPRLAGASVRQAWRVVNAAPLAACPDCGTRFIAQPLLDAMLRRAEAGGSSDAMRAPMQRCPACRHAGAHAVD